MIHGQYVWPLFIGSRGNLLEAEESIGAIAVFNLGRHGLTVLGMAGRSHSGHSHGEVARTVTPDSRFENGAGPGGFHAPGTTQPESNDVTD